MCDCKKCKESCYYSYSTIRRHHAIYGTYGSTPLTSTPIRNDDELALIGVDDTEISFGSESIESAISASCCDTIQEGLRSNEKEHQCEKERRMHVHVINNLVNGAYYEYLI